MNELIPINEGSNREKGRFKPGNPGKPKGVRNRATVMAEKLLSKDFKKIASVVTQAALEGDMVACRLVLERLAPVPKGRRLSFDMPTGLGLAGLSVAYDALLAAVGAGAVTVDEAAGIAGIIEKQIKVLEIDEVHKRLAALEAKAGLK